MVSEKYYWKTIHIFFSFEMFFLLLHLGLNAYILVLLINELQE